MLNLRVERISIAQVLQVRKHHAQLASLVPSLNNSALLVVSLMMLELAVQRANSAQKPPMMIPFYAIQELITLVRLERLRMTVRTVLQVNGVLRDLPVKPALAPALMALTALQERSFLMSMGALPARPLLAQATQARSLLARTAQSARGAVRASKRQPCAVM